jgi:CheY-like chemotaxis protein
LTQIFINLLDNALKFTREGSISFGISEIKDNSIEFFVSDTGIGIAKEKHSAIFDRFVQANDEIAQNYGGTGLGLSIVNKLIDLMGGNIHVVSEPSKGSLFRFTLPYVPITEIEKEAAEKSEYSVTDENLKILLVEDDPISSLYYKEILDKDFITLSIAENGKTALEMYNELKPDIILMDIRLNDMNGLDIVRKIRNTDQKVKIIAQTAYAMSSDEKQAIEAGCNDYIAKPINVQLLFHKIKAVQGVK